MKKEYISTWWIYLLAHEISEQWTRKNYLANQRKEKQNKQEQQQKKNEKNYLFKKRLDGRTDPYHSETHKCC